MPEKFAKLRDLSMDEAHLFFRDPGGRKKIFAALRKHLHAPTRMKVVRVGIIILMEIDAPARARGKHDQNARAFDRSELVFEKNSQKFDINAHGGSSHPSSIAQVRRPKNPVKSRSSFVDTARHRAD